MGTLGKGGLGQGAWFESCTSCHPVLFAVLSVGSSRPAWRGSQLEGGGVASARMNPRRTKPAQASQSHRTPFRVGVCVLAGGLSTRMGSSRDKAALRLGGRTLLSHARRTALAAGLEVRVIRRDAVPRCGPLGGILTGLGTSRGSAEIFLACDMPFVTPGLLRRLARHVKREGRAVFTRAPAPAKPWTDAVGEPARELGFPLVLRVEDLPVVEARVRSGRFSLRQLARSLGAVSICPPVSTRHQLLNINTPEEWARARAIVSRL